MGEDVMPTLIEKPDDPDWLLRPFKCQHCGIRVKFSEQEFKAGICKPIYQQHDRVDGSRYMRVTGVKVSDCPGCRSPQTMGE